MTSKKVAIVGGGVSGIGALWALKSTNHDVHLLESADRLGGHTNTAVFERHGRKTTVDTGFIVFNNATYPNFINFLKTINVEAVPTDMTFGVSRDAGAFEWSGTSLDAVFAQRKNIFSPRMWRMIFDIVRFNQFALDLLHYEDESEGDVSGAAKGSRDSSSAHPRHQESIGDYLERNGYSDAFRDDYLIPMTAAVWSTSPEKCSLEFPAMTLVRFMWNHHLLSTVAARPSWMTISNRSQSYIDAVLKDYPRENIHTSTRVVAVTDQGEKVVLRYASGEEELFDHVILACHGDTAYELVKNGATPEEHEILSGFKTTENIAYLHSDLSLMPRNRRAWSSWNLMTLTSPSSFPDAATSTTHDTSSAPSSVCLTYNMNILQHIPTATFGDILVTLNPITPPAPSSIQGRYVYHHPLYNTTMIQSQKRLPSIQNTRGISYAGAWTKYGFHEDGFSSGIKVAVEHLGAKLPFEFVDSTFSRGRRPVLTAADWAVRVVVLIIVGLIWVGEGVLAVLVGERGMKAIRNKKGKKLA